MRFLFTFLFCGSVALLRGQSFIFNQLFQPSVRFNAEYTSDWLGKNADYRASYLRSNINFIVPIKSKFGLTWDWEALTKVRKWGDLKNVVGVKAYQIFWNIRPMFSWLQYQNPDTEAAPFSAGNAYLAGLSTGITGMHFRKKFRILFYSINIGLHEQIQTLQRGRIRPTFTGLVGVAQARGLFFYWYYGLYVGYSNGQILPAPFIGVQAKIAPRLWLNITLPVQFRLGYAFTKKFQLDFVAGLSGWGGGFWAQNNAQRHFFSATQLRTALTASFRFSKQTRLYLEAGFLPYRRWSWGGWSIFGKQPPLFQQPILKPTFYFGLSLFYSFKKSLLGSAADGLIMF